jgi:hypothetical protein
MSGRRKYGLAGFPERPNSPSSRSFRTEVAGPVSPKSARYHGDELRS